VFLPKHLCLSRCRPGTNPAKFPEHLLAAKHCTLTLHVKAGSFASPFIYPRMLRCSGQDVLQCSVTQPQNAGKHRNWFAEHVTELAGANASPDPRWEPEKNEPEGM
jgi:hypothetical protein